MFMLDICLLLTLAFNVAVKGNEMEGDAADGVTADIVQTDSEVNSNQEHENQAQDDKHLLDHLADVVDLGGEGLNHIQEHLKEKGYQTQRSSEDVQAIKNGDDTKGIFYFFELHDFDKNGQLDGLELYHALTDYHSHDKPGKLLLEKEVESLIDNLLQKHDLNMDGYIDFVELMNSNPDSLWNQLGSNLKGIDADNQDEAGHIGTQEN